MRGVRIGVALGLVAVVSVAGLTGCAGGAGPDGPTDRACKELTAANHALASLPSGDLTGVDDQQVTAARAVADQLRTIATDASGGALADRLGGLAQAADDWERGWATRDAGEVQRVRQVVADDVAACSAAGVIG